MSTRRRVLKATMLATALIAAAASGASAQNRNCIDTLASMPEFSRFTNVVVNSRVANELRSANDITIFAPTNDALARLNPAVADRLFPRSEGARQPSAEAAPAVGAHILQGRRNAAALAQGGQFNSVSGTPLGVSSSGGVVTITGPDNTQAQVVRADIACSNGVIHAIDGVLVR